MAEAGDVAILDAALDYAQNRGWAVFPLHSARDGRCTCGRPDCTNAGKHPRTEHGWQDASRDADQIMAWWLEHPDSNVGIAAGLSDLAVIDVDPRHGGLESMDRLQLSTTRTVRTGSGGLHLYYSGAIAQRRLAAGIDLKSTGGYVVGPPSLHASGQRYEWINPDAGLAPFPAHLLTPAADATSPVGNTTTILPDQKRWVAELLTQECPQGQRNETLTRLAGYFRNLLPETVALSILGQWNQSYCRPPLADREVSSCVHHKYTRYAGWDAGPSESWTAKTLLDANLPDPVWIVEGLLPEGLGFLAGRPKRGKSWLALQVLLDVVTGSESLGKLTHQGRGIYLALEDSPRRLQKRLSLMGASRSDDLLILTQFPRLDEGGLEQLAELMDTHNPVLVVIDTLSRLLGRDRDQDKNADMTDVLDPLQKLAMSRGCAILLIDHHRKPGMEVADAIDDIMGSTAKGGVADTIWGLYRKAGESTGTLTVLGREVEAAELAVVWDGLRFRWRIEGTATEHVLQQRVAEVTNFLEETAEADVKTVAGFLHLSDDTALAILREMKARHLVSETMLHTGQRGRPRFVYSLNGQIGQKKSPNKPSNSV